MTIRKERGGGKESGEGGGRGERGVPTPLDGRGRISTTLKRGRRVFIYKERGRKGEEVF